MNDQELLTMVDEYLKDNDISIGEFFDQLGIARANYSRWKNGRPMSTKMRQKITAGVMPAIATKSVRCYFDKCPAEPPADRFLQVVLESWNGLTINDRAKVAALAAELLEKSGVETGAGEVEDGMGKNHKAN